MAQKMRPQAETLSGSPQPNFTGYTPSPILSRRNPSTADTGYALGQVWVNKLLNSVYVLASVSAGSATWVVTGGGAVDLSTLTGDTGGAIVPVGGNINISGGTNIAIAGSAGQLTPNITGQIPVANGGTGVPTLTGIPLAAGTAAFTGLTYVAPTSWTPNIQINGSSTGITYSLQTGYYTRIANLVVFGFRIVLSSKGASNGNVTISNMPVTTGANGINFQCNVTFTAVTFTATNTGIRLQTSNGTAVANFDQFGGAETSIASLTDANIANASAFQATGSYIIV